jgi:hypothetical protein
MSDHDRVIAEALARIEKGLASAQQRADLDALAKKMPASVQRVPRAKHDGGAGPGPGGGPGAGPGPPALPPVPGRPDNPPPPVAAIELPPISPEIAARHRRLDRRAGFVRRALTSIRTSLASRDWALRGDISALELQMEDAMHTAAAAIERRQELEAVTQLDAAERAIESLERSLKI